MAPEILGHLSEDHEAGETGHPSFGGASSTGGSTFVPLAEPLPYALDEDAEFTSDPESGPVAVPQAPPPLRHCRIDLREGCYHITFKPNSGVNIYHGTMRVDLAGGQTTVSGDLYRFLQHHISPFPGAPVEPAPQAFPFSFHYDIPIYARDRYYSYLKVTNIQRSPVFTAGPCRLTLTAQEYVYTQPPAGTFDGTFPAAPGTRTVTIVLHPKHAPYGFTSSYFEGTLYDAGVAQGSFTMGWVSPFFRKATLEIDTLVGAVAPQPVPAHSGSGTEDFKTVFATAGWDLKVVRDQVDIPVPAGVNADECWLDGDLHNLMLTVRNPATNLDAEWHIHLIVVPAKMGCGRGVMYDIIGVPREGVASFCSDGYPADQSANFGTAANKRQRDVPRAFMRSASHEVGHGFNQIHQEQEGGADNSIMTTTPSVADVLGGPTTGEPGVFPDDINLAFNNHVRHHLVHFPDIVVRPGGMTFGSGHFSVVPEADRYFFSQKELELKLEAVAGQIELGEPLQLSWLLLNQSEAPVPVPSNINTESQHAFITVTTPNGTVKAMPSFVIRTDKVKIVPLQPEERLQGNTRVFWSAKGFAFETPGKYVVELKIVWTSQGVPLGVKSSIDIWVNYPQSQVDNDAAATLLHSQVGMYVALGGNAPHLTEAVARLERVSAPAQVAALAKADQRTPKALRGYQGLLPKKKVPVKP